MDHRHPDEAESDRSIVAVPSRDTHPLRRLVLRSGTPGVRVEFDGDDDPTTWHLAVRSSDGAVIGVSSWYVRSHASTPAVPAVQLRGMAVSPDRQGSGVGSTLLEEGLVRAASGGAVLVWARARDTALSFYRQHGFDVIGDGYVDATTGLPHHDVIRRLTTTS